MKVINCTRCNKPDGTVRKCHISNDVMPEMEDVVELMHETCAWLNILDYQARKEAEREAA